MPSPPSLHALTYVVQPEPLPVDEHHAEWVVREADVQPCASVPARMVSRSCETAGSSTLPSYSRRTLRARLSKNCGDVGGKQHADDFDFEKKFQGRQAILEVSG